MTIVLESYCSNDGIRSNIQQEKYCKSYQLDVFRLINGGPVAQSIYRGNYTTKQSARRAMKRFADDWTNTYKR